MARGAPNAAEMKKALRLHARRDKAHILQGFFKTGPGQYGEGDRFLGVVVPDIRRVAGKYRDAPESAVVSLLASEYHEERLLALLILVQQFFRGNEQRKKRIYTLYLKNVRCINNWDLVDLSAPNIMGAWLADKSRKRLHQFARSKNVWKRRIAILSTFAFIRNNNFSDTLTISKTLLRDEHDLIHKAVGWMLREVGKRSPAAEESFLKQHYRTMPRTMLRYAVERFPEAKRKRYLEGKV
ncbi:MAG TPA: DNA alkylation repair protein [Nitrospirota bacterium]|nr:DNA alkylation repair protein [Nitrospirota bacterium]